MARHLNRRTGLKSLIIVRRNPPWIYHHLLPWMTSYSIKNSNNNSSDKHIWKCWYKTTRPAHFNDMIFVIKTINRLPFIVMYTINESLTNSYTIRKLFAIFDLSIWISKNYVCKIGTNVLLMPCQGNSSVIIGPLWAESTGHSCIFPHKWPLIWSLVFYLLLFWTKCCNKSRVTCDLRRHCAYATSL